MSTKMTKEETSIHKAALKICGASYEDAPDCSTILERLEWVRRNCMGQGTDGEISADELGRLIARAKAANV